MSEGDGENSSLCPHHRLEFQEYCKTCHRKICGMCLGHEEHDRKDILEDGTVISESTSNNDSSDNSSSGILGSFQTSEEESTSSTSTTDSDDDKTANGILENEEVEEEVNIDLIEEDPIIKKYISFNGVEELISLKNEDRLHSISVARQTLCYSNPVKFLPKMNLESGLSSIRASISHQGILAISGAKESETIPKYVLQLIDLNKLDVENFDVNHETTVGFYDDNFVLLTSNEKLKEGNVKIIFTKHEMSSLKEYDVNGVSSATDVSRLNVTRKLYYTTRSPDYKCYLFNVDSKVNTPVDIKIKVNNIISTCGIDLNAEFFFSSRMKVYSYNCNGTTSLIRRNCDWVTNILADSREPQRLDKSVLKNGDRLLDSRGNVISLNDITLDSNYSIVRLLGNIFLLYNARDNNWVHCKLVACSRR